MTRALIAFVAVCFCACVSSPEFIETMAGSLIIYPQGHQVEPLEVETMLKFTMYGLAEERGLGVPEMVSEIMRYPLGIRLEDGQVPCESNPDGCGGTYATGLSLIRVNWFDWECPPNTALQHEMIHALLHKTGNDPDPSHSDEAIWGTSDSALSRARDNAAEEICEQ